LGQWILIDLSFGSTSWISQQNTLVAEQNHYTMPTLLDTKAEIFAKYGLVGTPGTFIAHRQGNFSCA
jgi:hypothetical protein